MRVTTLLSLLAVAALIVFGIAAFHMGWLSPAPAGEGSGEPLIQLSKADINSITVAAEGAPTIRIARVGDHWRITSPIWGRADEDQIRQAVHAVARLTIARRYGPDDEWRPPAEKTGLATPRMMIAVTDVRGQRHEIAIGVHPPLIRETYAQIRGQDDIFLIGPDPVDILGRPYGDYRDSTLLEFDPTRLTRLILAGRVNYELIRHGDSWRITAEGVHSAAADGNKTAELISNLASLKIADFTPAEATDLEAFGLNPPGMVFVLMLKPLPGEVGLDPPSDPSGPNTIEAMFGSQDGNVYVMVESQRRLFTIPPADYEELAVELDDIRDHRVLPFHADHIVRLDVQIAGDAISLTRVDHGWTAAAGDVDTAVVSRLLNALGTLQADSYISRYSSLIGYGLAEPAARFRAVADDGSACELLVSEWNDGRDTGYVKLNADTAVMMVRLGDLAAAADQLRETPGWQAPPTGE